MDKIDSCPPGSGPKGPVLQEANISECFFDLRKLPAQYKKLRLFTTRDRDTGMEVEIVVKWADQVLYKDCDTSKLPKFKEKLQAKHYKLSHEDKRLTLRFQEGAVFHGQERRTGRDRRSAEDRRREDRRK